MAHVDLRQGPFNVPPSPAGTRLAGHDLLAALPPTAAGKVVASIAATAARTASDEAFTAVRAALAAWGRWLIVEEAERR